MEYYAVSKHIYIRPQDTKDIHSMSFSFKRVCLNDSFFISTKRCITGTISIYEIGIMNSLKEESALMRKADSLEKTPLLGKIAGRRRRG